MGPGRHGDTMFLLDFVKESMMRRGGGREFSGGMYNIVLDCHDPIPELLTKYFMKFDWKLEIE